MPIIITILEMRELEMWGVAFLKTTEVLSGKTGISVRVSLAQKPGGKFLMVGADAYPADNPLQPRETPQNLVLWTVAVFM